MIPARGGSKRLRAKNVRKLDGKPLVAHTIEAGLESEIFDELIVSTDDEEIAKIASDYNASVPFIRPAEFATDEAQVKDVAKHAIKYFEKEGKNFDEVMCLLPTTPLRAANDIKQSYRKFNEKNCNYLISVTDYRYTPVRAFTSNDKDFLEPYWLGNSSMDERSEIFARSQEHPDFLVDCGAIYLMDTDKFLNDHTLHGENCVGYYMPPERAIDIDDRFDFKLAELILQEKLALEKEEEEGYDMLKDGRY